jgi:Family of unknown function (DUF6152)
VHHESGENQGGVGRREQVYRVFRAAEGILPPIRLAPLRGRFMTGVKQLAVPGLLAATLALTSSSPAWSHHSHAMFDHDKEVTITGTVSQWIFRNPHVFLYVDAKTEAGEAVTYTVEMSNITNMLKVGFSATTFKAGDKVTVTIHPLIDGRPGGNYIVATSADGKQFGRI